MAKSKLLICPYCGDAQPTGQRCRACGGLFEQLSRQASHNAMGPWFIRDEDRPFQPGCSYETLVRLIERNQVTKLTILRGPTTKQFWTVAKRAAGIAHLLGYCHQCDASVDPGDHGCHACGVPFGAYLDRNYMGLPEVKPMPWEADVDDEFAASEDAPGLRMSPSTHGRLSSFASDAELMHGTIAFDVGEPARGLSTRAPQATAEPAPAPVATTATAAAAPAPLPPADEGPATRALRRRVARQQQSIRMLLVALVVLALLLVVSNLGALTGTRGGSSAPTDEQPTGATSPPKESPAPSIDEPALVEPAPDEPETTAPDPPTEADPAKPPPTIDLTEPAVALDSPEDEQALRLLAEAGREDRSLEDRLRDCDQALEILRGLQASGQGDTARREQLIEQAEALARRIVDAFYAEDGAS